MKMAKGRSGVDASPASNKKGNEVLLQNENQPQRKAVC